MISILKNQIVERDQSIGTSQEKLMRFEEKVAGLEREIHDLKGLKLEADRTVEDMRREKSEADQKIRRRNSEAVETIEGLRREKSEADQTVEQLRRQNGEAVETIEGLRREKSEAHQMVEDLKRKNTEDIETIKRLRWKISTVNREKMSSDQTRAETSSKNSEEADEEMKQLRKQNFEASEIIGQLRRKVIAAEMGKMSSDQIVKEMKHKLSEAEKRAEEHKCKNLEAFNRQISAAVETEKTKSEVHQIVKELKRKYSEALRTIEELKRQKLEAKEAGRVDKKRSANMESRVKRLEEGFANRKKVKVGNLDNVGKSDDKFGTTKKVEDVSMHACSGPSKIGSRELTPQTSSTKERNANDRGNGGKIFKGADCIEVICVDDETSLSGSPNMSEKEKISEKFPLTNDLQLCMNAVCVLYRQQISASESTTQDLYGVLSHSDALRVRALGEYLVDGGQGLRLGKSLYEVKQDRPDVLVECRRLATNYLRIYCNGENLSMSSFFAYIVMGKIPSSNSTTCSNILN
ncbi:hypothetical protein ACJIZ3_019630 [Penstemon smallii]|uniref:Uncharacterized protein n=1 Tax=Penstemon smallii TaxID=265156 RepID=A0ABD3T2E1_9LAMI